MFKYVDLGARKTPLQFCPEFSNFLGVPFYVKREDICGTKFGMNGGDSRKIEFLLQEISVAKPDVMVIVSHYRSNFTRMLVQAVANMVFCHVIYVDEFSKPVSYSLSQIQVCGAQTHGQQDLEYVNTLIANLQAEDKKVFVVRPGGACSVAAMGGYALFDEIALDLMVEHELNEATVYVASDSGATQAGMISASGVRFVTIPHGIVTIGVPFGKDLQMQSKLVLESYEHLGSLCSDEDRYEVQDINSNFNVLLSDSQYHPGDDEFVPDDLSTDLITLATEFYQRTSLVVDYVYGLPVLSALVADVKEGRITGPVVFVNPVSPTVPFYNY